MFWERILTFVLYYNRTKQTNWHTYYFSFLKLAHLVIPIAYFWQIYMWDWKRSLLNINSIFFLFWFSCWVHTEFMSEFFKNYVEHYLLIKAIIIVAEWLQVHALYETNSFTRNDDFPIWLILLNVKQYTINQTFFEKKWCWGDKRRWQHTRFDNTESTNTLAINQFLCPDQMFREVGVSYFNCSVVWSIGMNGYATTRR